MVHFFRVLFLPVCSGTGSFPLHSDTLRCLGPGDFPSQSWPAGSCRPMREADVVQRMGQSCSPSQSCQCGDDQRCTPWYRYRLSVPTPRPMLSYQPNPSPIACCPALRKPRIINFFSLQDSNFMPWQKGSEDSLSGNNFRGWEGIEEPTCTVPKSPKWPIFCPAENFVLEISQNVIPTWKEVKVCLKNLCTWSAE